MTRLQQVHQTAATQDNFGTARMITLFAPKGGVGKTTLAFNLAVAVGQQGCAPSSSTAALQFGDMRALLKVPMEAPSLLDLPTDRIQESDLADVLWRDPSGIDILLAPPRVEMAEMVTVRDLEKTLSLLRRVYEVVIVDTPAVVNDINLAFLDASDTILEVVTYDSTTIHSTMVMADAFRMIGYAATKVRYLVNRADSTGGFDPEVLSRALGRIPEHSVASGGALVVRTNNEGIPFVLADPSAQISQDVTRTATELVGPRGARGGTAVACRGVRPPAHRRLRLRRRRPHGPPRDPPPVTARVHDLPRRQRARALRRPLRTTRSGGSRWRRSTSSPPATSRRSSSPATPRPPSRSRDLRARYDLPVLGVVRPGAAAAALATRNRRVGVIATPATVRSHAYFNAIKDENPAVEVYEHATPRFVPMVEAGILSGPEMEAAVAEELAPLLGERDGEGEFVFPRPAGAAIDTLLLGCTHYPLIRPVIAAAVGDRVAIVDSATATASSLAELLSVNGLEAPGTTRGTAADPGAAGHSRPEERWSGTDPVHVQLTTGDIEPVHRRSPRGCSARRSRTSTSVELRADAALGAAG